jgi:hypothetical protein
VVDGSGLENRQGASPRGFESHPLRHSILDFDFDPQRVRFRQREIPRRVFPGSPKLLLPSLALLPKNGSADLDS